MLKIGENKERAFMFNRLSRKLWNAKRSYFKERLKQRQHLNEEISRLDMLLKEKVIDEDTHKRLRKLLEMGYQKKRQETRLKYGFQ
jgi:uncharacterized Fe-S cluster-containing radical SAM superfamily protein